MDFSENTEPFMLGVAANLAVLPAGELALMREAGIGWLRCGKIHFEAAAFLQGRGQGEKFEEVKEKIRRLRAEGFQIMGLTPGPRELKDQAGEPGSAAYFENYRKICGFLAREFHGLIGWWQVANELDIWIFRETLSMEQSAEFLKAGLRGVKDTDRNLKAGINITLFPSLPGEVDGNTDRHEGVFLAKAIYGDRDLETDYAGFDSYPGTWRKGGVESWEEYLDGFHQLTGKPVVIQEFGYSSAGEMMTETEDLSGVYPCQAKKWRFGWNGGHTPENQARFIGESFKVFARKPFVIGATYYSWRDAAQCWQCGEGDCPAETAWGLLDRQGRPKPAYFGFQSAAKRYFENAVV